MWDLHEISVGNFGAHEIVTSRPRLERTANDTMFYILVVYVI